MKGQKQQKQAALRPRCDGAVGAAREGGVMATAKKPKIQPRGRYALDPDDPRWFPMAQGETLYQVLAWMVNHMLPPEVQLAFVEGLAEKAIQNMERIRNAATATAEQQPAAGRKKARG
jgi:hypothetical protein